MSIFVAVVVGLLILGILAWAGLIFAVLLLTVLVFIIQPVPKSRPTSSPVMASPIKASVDLRDVAVDLFMVLCPLGWPALFHDQAYWPSQRQYFRWLGR